MPAKYTKHSRERMKRLGLPKRMIKEMAIEALQYGHGQASFKGNFRKYLDKLGRTYLTSPIVYKGNIFIYNGDTLVTAWSVPQQFRDYKPNK